MTGALVLSWAALGVGFVFLMWVLTSCALYVLGITGHEQCAGCGAHTSDLYVVGHRDGRWDDDLCLDCATDRTRAANAAARRADQ